MEATHLWLVHHDLEHTLARQGQLALVAESRAALLHDARQPPHQEEERRERREAQAAAEDGRVVVAPHADLGGRREPGQRRHRRAKAKQHPLCSRGARAGDAHLRTQAW